MGWRRQPLPVCGVAMLSADHHDRHQCDNDDPRCPVSAQEFAPEFVRDIAPDIDAPARQFFGHNLSRPVAILIQLELLATLIALPRVWRRSTTAPWRVSGWRCRRLDWSAATGARLPRVWQLVEAHFARKSLPPFVTVESCHVDSRSSAIAHRPGSPFHSDRRPQPLVPGPRSQPFTRAVSAK
jgi:hypothetical protein